MRGETDPDPGTKSSIWQALTVVLALCALAFSVVSFVLQSRTDDAQKKLAERQMVLSESQAKLKAEQERKAEEVPRVSVWLDSVNHYLYITNRDKDGLTEFYAEARDQIGLFSFLPACKSTTILLTPELSSIFHEGFTAHFESGGKWWTMDAKHRVVQVNAKPTEGEPNLNWSGVTYISETECET
ncbi:hypothetical protein [Streptomyces sp. NPDC054854]